MYCPHPLIAGRYRCGTYLLRAILLASAASMLAGCITARAPEATASVPNDYRQRHPIVIKEGERTVEIFVGSNRGGLTPAQQAEVLAFAGLETRSHRRRHHRRSDR